MEIIGLLILLALAGAFVIFMYGCMVYNKASKSQNEINAEDKAQEDYLKNYRTKSK